MAGFPIGERTDNNADPVLDGSASWRFVLYHSGFQAFSQFRAIEMDLRCEARRWTAVQGTDTSPINRWSTHSAQRGITSELISDDPRSAGTDRPFAFAAMLGLGLISPATSFADDVSDRPVYAGPVQVAAVADVR